MCSSLLLLCFCTPMRSMCCPFFVEDAGRDTSFSRACMGQHFLRVLGLWQLGLLDTPCCIAGVTKEHRLKSQASLRPSQRPPPGRVLDIMPGYANVKRQYYRTGFTFDAAGNAVSREDLPPTPPVSATSSRAGSGAKDAISSKTPSVRPSMLRSNSLPSGSHAATAAAGFSRSPHVPGGAIEEDFKLLIKKTCSRSKDLYFC
eukprot:TRINITY_DN37679_c0_g2_i6.p1 TRINITY_DN37679_c0_g2~~TRINITY_DN37679_c0_g2_i6.p1  ORF type:complete len:202 (+),score=20.63 TRINITY_DN37679_c0_g2_i6:62-667(+)